MIHFSHVSPNNPALKGRLAAPRQYFGPGLRYAVAPVHTRFDAVEWFVWDFEAPVSDKHLVTIPVIRQEATLDETLLGLYTG